jgi:hypothetical protein
MTAQTSTLIVNTNTEATQPATERTRFFDLLKLVSVAAFQVALKQLCKVKVVKSKLER